MGVLAPYSLTDAPGGAACGVRVSLGHCRLPLSTVRATSLAQVKVEKQRFGINDTGFANRSTTDPQHPLWWACQHSPAQIRYFLRHLQQIKHLRENRSRLTRNDKKGPTQTRSTEATHTCEGYFHSPHQRLLQAGRAGTGRCLVWPCMSAPEV